MTVSKKATMMALNRLLSSPGFSPFVKIVGKHMKIEQ